MPKAVEAASFDDFLKAPSRVAKKAAASSRSADGKDSLKPKAAALPARSQPERPSRKEKVGLTIDSDILDAIDDYIYLARKQGRRLKKNDVYEAALRQFLGMEGGETR